MPSGKKTKIIATIGPASESIEIITQLIKAGVNIFRFNMKHNVKEWHIERIKRVQSIADELKIAVGILIDLQGPEIRIETDNQISTEIVEDDYIIFTDDFEEAKKESVAVSLDADYPIVKVPSILIKTLEVGDHFTIDDGFMEFEITNKQNRIFVAKALDKGTIKNRKSLNLVGKDVELPSLIEDDLDKLDIASKSKVDFIALSFVRTKEDVITLKKEMDARKLKAKIIAKIESEKGVHNLDEIIDYSDAIMVARGDLGVEVPIERIAYLQKEMIKKCRAQNKQVIVATQMLLSMVDNARPTRAEATDVSNAVYDGADAVMLSNESATGKHPVKTVEVMRRIVKFNEDKTDFSDFTSEVRDQSNALVKGALAIIESKMTHIDKILVFTETGYSAQIISSYRPKNPIIAISDNKETVESLTLCYGVIPTLVKFPHGEFSFEDVKEPLISQGHVAKGDKVLIIHGKRWKDPGKTNALVVLEV